MHVCWETVMLVPADDEIHMAWYCLLIVVKSMLPFPQVGGYSEQYDYIYA